MPDTKLSQIIYYSNALEVKLEKFSKAFSKEKGFNLFLGFLKGEENGRNRFLSKHAVACQDDSVGGGVMYCYSDSQGHFFHTIGFFAQLHQATKWKDKFPHPPRLSQPTELK